ncbi:anti-restriction protein [Escherichia coli T426]|nr:anti-restriction protein [Escherichia coli T426]
MEVMRRVLCIRRNKEVAGGSAFTRPCGAWPCGVFPVMWPQRRVRAVPCLHLSRAGVDARVRFAAAVTRSLLPVCCDFPVVRPLRFRGLTLQLPSAVCVRLRLPLRPCIPACSPGFYGGTAPPGAAEHVTMEDSGMSVVAPAVYVGTWHKYNCGSIAGRWFDLTTFDDERDFFAACRALHQDEADPELMFQDYEGFPGNMASECHINWAWVEGFRQARDEGCEEAYRLWVDDTGETDFDTFRDAWWGEADSEEAFAVEFVSDTGLLADVPETVALYFDYEAYARDLFLDSFTFIDGHVFRR